LGLCRPVGEKDEKKIFGILPYVAPEVLNKKGCSQASDIYSFGILIYKIFTGLPPYAVYNKKINGYEEIPHDFDLATKICKGLRPNLDDGMPIPQLLENLIKRC